MTAGGREPIAIVGIGCRLPGGASDPTSLWRMLCDGVDAITPIPPDRFDVDRLYDEQPATAGRIMSRWGGFIDDIEGFDAAFFETAPREAQRLDPQQRLLLETSWEALEDAGLAREAVAGTNAGVYVGMWINEYESRLFADTDQIDFHMTTGSGRYAASGRLSYFFDLLGPSITVDTACSSSLVAIHLACQALASGECDLALAGGANVIVEPFITIAYSQSRMMAPDGHCKFGDVGADGYVRSDGAVMIALKRQSRAQADGDHIYAVIRGSAVTNDGRSSGFLATPGQAGQEEMLRRAYADAGVDPRSVQYVEAHGTGTAAGDPVELAALGAIVGGSRDELEPCLVGSIKSNVGHTEGAAGAAGLVKLALALQHGEIPASLHVSQPNPAIAWQQLGMRVSGLHQRWPAVDGPRRGGVSAFGIAGTNAHVVLEEAPATPSSPAASTASGRTAQLLAISASGRGALRALAGRYATLLEQGVESIGDLCAAAALGRSQLTDRLAVVGNDSAQLAAGLRRRIEASDAAPRHRLAAPRVVFVFPGQGSQWHGMARELLATEPTFSAAMAACDAAIGAEAGWSPIELLTAAEPASRIDDIDVVQPLLFAVQVSLAALWSAWGIRPDAVVGHSMGEVAAAHVAGALDLAAATAVICRRSTLLRRISGQGAMALVDLPLDATVAAIAGRESMLSIAVSNSPRSTVISGDPGALQEVLDKLQADDVFCRPVKVDVASHSPQVDPLLDELRAQLADVVPATTSITFRSTVTGAVVDGADLDAAYWAANLRRPVMFGDAIAELAAVGPTTFVELSPHPILLPSIDQVLRDAAVEHHGSVLSSMRRDEPQAATMLSALGSLYESGATVEWPAVSGPPATHVRLPTYPWQHERHWYDPPRRGVGRAGGHPLLGHAVRPAADPGTVHWQTSLDGDDVAFLRDHVVQGSAVLAATGFVELARVASLFDEPSAALMLTDLVLHESLPIDPAHPRNVQITVDHSSSATRCRVYSRDAFDDAEWRLHAEVHVDRDDGDGAGRMHEAVADIRARCAEHRDADAHRADMQSRGLAYAGVFRSVGDVWAGPDEALGQIDGTTSRPGSAERRISVLDGCLQVALAALPRSTVGATFVPVRVERLLLGSIEDAAWSHARVTHFSPDVARCDVTVIDADGRCVAQCAGLELRRVGSRDHRLGRLFFDLHWQPSPLPPAATDPGSARTWIVYAAHGAGDDVATRLRRGGDRCVIVRPDSAFARTGEDEWSIGALSVADHRAVLSEVLTATGCADVVYAWPAPEDDRADDRETFGYMAAVALVQALGSIDHDTSPRLWLVTRGAHATSPEQALLWGLGRVAANEQPALRCSLVDLAPDGIDEADLFDELRCALPDQQVSFFDGVRHVARLQRRAHATHQIDRSGLTDSFRLVAAVPGSLDTVRPRLHTRAAPGPGEVEVRVTAAALNFLDVLKAMGIYPGLESTPMVALGAESAGVVEAVGEGVEHVAVGDVVVAITPSYRDSSLLASFVTVPAEFVQPRPASMSVEEASAAAIAYVTAYYSLHELARVRAGETVLVHAASGGVGLAAIEMCRHLGATVIATAGSERKRAHVRSLGVEHVFDSRTTAFADHVREVTNGRGVDVVLNSLVGDAIPAGFSALAPGGRFVEIGKRDVYAHSRLDLALFKNNVALFVVDLADLTEQRPTLIATMFATVMTLLADGRLPALPTTALPLGAAAEAFRTMARADHIGKLVVTMPSEHVVADTPAIRSDSTYLVTGGLGGLGLAVAGRLVERGARHIALMGRSEPGPAAERAVVEMRERGAHVMVVSADVSAAGDLGDAIARVRAEMPPLRGVVHAAGVLADATIATMDEQRALAALAPKVRGASNLHHATLDDPLDHFVLFSSVAAVLGLAGQSNYAAGNAFLDALAAHRRAMGRPALSIQWGPWAEIGLAAATSERGDRLAARGLGSLDPAEALDAFDLLLDTADDTVAVMRMDATQWVASAAGAATAALVGDLSDTGEVTTDTGASLPDLLRGTPAGPRRRRALEDALCAELAPVLRVQLERIDRQQPMKNMGLDSLMALELRNRLEAVTGLTISATVVWNYPTVAVLAEHLATRLTIALDADIATPQPSQSADASQPAPEEAVATTASASQAELEAMLIDELAAVDRLLDTDGRSS